MLFSKAEMGALRFTGTYKDIPAKIIKEEGGDLFRTLIDYGYLRQNKTGVSLRLTEAGAEILQAAGFTAEKDTRYIGEGKTLKRRLENAETAWYFFEAGINIFHTEIPGRVLEQAYLPSSAVRRQKSANVFGISKFNGLLYTPEYTYAAYCVSDPAETFFPANDEKVFSKEIIRTDKQVKVLYVSDSGMENMVKQYAAAKTEHCKASSHNFFQAVDKFTVPVCFVSTDNVNQLRIITAPDYRTKLARYMLPASYMPPKYDFADALFDSDKYLVVLIDFDVKRLETALKYAANPHILVLNEQADALTVLLSGRAAEIFAISANEAMRVLDLTIGEDGQKQVYINKKGEAVIANKTKKNKD